jgi:hypothetical protein
MYVCKIITKHYFGLLAANQQPHRRKYFWSKIAAAIASFGLIKKLLPEFLCVNFGCTFVAAQFCCFYGVFHKFFGHL